MSSSISIKSLCKSYTKNEPVLKSLNLEIAAGELFFLLGPSGCGKSTLLRILAGLVKQDCGTISFNGVEISNLPPERRRSAMVFQNYALWPHLSVFENVAFGLRAMKRPGAEIKAKVTDALSLVRLSEYSERKIPSLSGGQQQRVALARAIAVDPAVLLLDEPLSNLDARLRDTMRAEIQRVVKARALTAVYVTHDRKEALATADRAAVMHNGVLQQSGTPRELYLKPSNPFVAEFLGDANFIDGVMTGKNQVKTNLGYFEVNTEKLSGNVRLMFRPEALQFANGGVNRFVGNIVSELYAGESAEYRVVCNNDNVKMRIGSPPVVSPLGEFEFEIAPSSIRVFEV